MVDWLWLLFPVVLLLISLHFLRFERETHGKGIVKMEYNRPPIFPNIVSIFLQLVLKSDLDLPEICRRFTKAGRPAHSAYFPWPKLELIGIHDFSLAKELLSGNAATARPTTDLYHCHSQGNYGIVLSSGKVWEEQRRWTFRKLKDAGVGNPSMEFLIEQEVENFVQILKDTNGKVRSPEKLTGLPMLNSLWVIIAGQRFEEEQKSASKMILNFYESFLNLLRLPQSLWFGLSKSPIPLPLLTWILTCLPVRTYVEKAILGFKDLNQFSEKLIGDRRKILEGRGKNQDNFIDAYIEKIEETTDETSSFYKDEGWKNLRATISDLVIAGGDTGSTTLLWAMIHLIRNPAVQLKIQLEIDAAVGRERRPTLADRPKCPYCVAFLMETLRVTPLILVNFPHMATEDVQVGPHWIEKGTTVILNVPGIHEDPKLWEDPKTFRPERFLTEDGQTVVKRDGWIPFSIGRRRCPGERLAMDNLFLFLTAICHEFTLMKDPSTNELPSIVPKTAVLLAPKPFYMMAVKRT